MAFFNLKCLIVAMISLPIITAAAAGDSDDICNAVECGKGSCEADPSYPFNFKCNCDSGWKRTRLDNEDDLQFLPCIIPNCSVNYSCMPAAPPPPPRIPYNTSFFDPCYWTYCGEGTCAKNTTYVHKCECKPGYYNLLNITAFPCYSDCAVNSDDCERLGIKVANSTSGSPSGSSSDQENHAVTFAMGKLNWMAILVLSAAMVFWK